MIFIDYRSFNSERNKTKIKVNYGTKLRHGFK